MSRQRQVCRHKRHFTIHSKRLKCENKRDTKEVKGINKLKQSANLPQGLNYSLSHTLARRLQLSAQLSVGHFLCFLIFFASVVCENFSWNCTQKNTHHTQQMMIASRKGRAQIKCLLRLMGTRTRVGPAARVSSILNLYHIILFFFCYGEIEIVARLAALGWMREMCREKIQSFFTCGQAKF
jgi:hypothetical protein